MLYDARFEKAIEMLSRQLEQMKKELLEVKAMRLKKKRTKNRCVHGTDLSTNRRDDKKIS